MKYFMAARYITISGWKAACLPTLIKWRKGWHASYTWVCIHTDNVMEQRVWQAPARSPWDSSHHGMWMHMLTPTWRKEVWVIDTWEQNQRHWEQRRRTRSHDRTELFWGKRRLKILTESRGVGELQKGFLGTNGAEKSEVASGNNSK